MASPNEYDDVPMLPVSDTSSSSRTRPFPSRSRSISLANTSYTEPPPVQMGDPLSSTRSPEPPFSLPPPSTGGSSDSIGASSSQPERNHHAYNYKAAQIHTPKVSATSDSTLHDALDDDAKGWARRFSTSVDKYLPKIMTPEKFQRWTQFFAYSCMLSIFVDPLFFFTIEVSKRGKCMTIDFPMAYTLVALRILTDVLFFVNIVLQFRLAYIAPESTVVGSGQLVKDPIKIARRYCRGYFLVDLYLVIPYPQMFILWIMLPHRFGTNDAKTNFLIIVLLQYIPKLWRFLPLVAGQTPTGFIFESAFFKFFINLLTFMLAGHVVGASWYLLGLQRVHQCFRDACNYRSGCEQLIYCRENRKEILHAWNGNARANACYVEEGFHYGIYWKAVNLTHDSTRWYTRYSYSLFWGFQQISTLAGNQVPSYFFGDILFTMIIIGLGLLLFGLLIGNIHNFLQSLGRRDMEMTLRRLDVEQCMSHRRFPEDIRKRVRDAERLNWNATRGVNEELLFGNMPHDLQRDIRRHRFAFLKKVRIFSKMDEKILDAIREKLKQRIYLKGSMVLRRGELVKNMVFILSGEMVSTGEDGSPTPLLKEDGCGEELLTWCQNRSSVNPDGARKRMPSEGLKSKRDVYCMTDVEAFSLSVEDLEDIVSLFSNFEIPTES